MTGLGGGVFIIPWLTGVTRLRFEQALSCSLLTIATTAPFSAMRQVDINLSVGEWLGLGGGILVTSFIVKKGSSYIPPAHMTIVHKFALTCVILLSMSRTLAVLFCGT